MSKAKDKVQNFMGNLPQFVKLLEPQSYENLTIIPLLLKDDLLDYITIKEAETADIGFVQELESEEVANLQAKNSSTKPMLIPYMQTVSGGKQDRTIYEPILVAAGQTIAIPSKCIERSRWTYRSAQEAASKKFYSSPMKMTIGVQAKAMRSGYRSRNMQSEVWNAVESMSDRMSIGRGAAPTRSGIDLQKTQEKKIQDYLKHFKLVKNQAGVIGLVNNQVVSMELYGNPTAFKTFWEDLINSLAMESLIRKRDAKDLQELDAAEIHEKALTSFKDHSIEFKERDGTGLGKVVEFADAKLVWAGITLIHENKFAHFYVVGKSVFPDEQPPARQMRTVQLQRQINPEVQQRFTGNVQREISPEE